MDSDARRGLVGAAEGQCAGDHRARRGTDADGRRIVTLDLVGPVKVRFHGGDVGGGSRTGYRERCCDGVGQRIGGDAVHHLDAVQGPFSGPPGTLEVAAGPRPGPRCADPLHRSDPDGVDERFDAVQRRRSHTLEACLNGGTLEACLNGGTCGFGSEEEFIELRHRRDRWFLQIYIRAGGQCGQCQRRVRLDGGGDDDDVG